MQEVGGHRLGWMARETQKPDIYRKRLNRPPVRARCRGPFSPSRPRPPRPRRGRRCEGRGTAVYLPEGDAVWLREERTGGAGCVRLRTGTNSKRDTGGGTHHGFLVV